MAVFKTGQRVTVLNGYPTGLGTIWHVYGGPVDYSYSVLMDQRAEDGQRTSVTTLGPDMTLAAPIVPYEVGQQVTYFGRRAVITDLIPATDPNDPRDQVLRIQCDQDPPEMFSGVEHAYLFVLPAWKLYAYAR
jgi:hypothetical protein